MIYKLHLMLITLVLLTSCNTQINSQIDDKAFLGHWTAYSKSSRSIEGDMVVAQDHIDFTITGRVEFEVESYNGKEYILHITNKYPHGNYMRIGPINVAEFSDSLEMEVAFFASKEKALAKRIGRMDNVSSWGIYLRK